MALQEEISPTGEVTGDVVITTYPPSAEIYMDDHLVIDTDTKESLKTPVILAMYMGLHDLRFVLPGYCNEFATVYIIPASGATYIHRDFNIC